MKEKKLELLNIIYVCVCVKLSLGQGKIKTYAHTHLSERDLNQNDEMSGHTRGFVEQSLFRRRKEQVLRRIPPRPPST
jgi:hypothetical protein